MMLREAIAAAATRLTASSETPRLDAELLAAHASGISREQLLLGHLDGPVPDGFALLIDRRAAHEPVAYITGLRDFWTIALNVAPGVLIPRPDSETLIEVACDYFKDRDPKNILDLGVGSGALLLAGLAEWPAAKGVGIDRSEQAIAIAKDNALRLGLADRADIGIGDWGQGITGRFDLILCNPPYIRLDAPLPIDVAAYEPPSALFAGEDGLDAYRAIAPKVADLMTPEAIAIFEIGWDQGGAVCGIFTAAGFTPRIVQDLGRRDRCVVLNPLTTPLLQFPLGFGNTSD